jgi:hypothetical protein
VPCLIPVTIFITGSSSSRIGCSGRILLLLLGWLVRLALTEGAVCIAVE